MENLKETIEQFEKHVPLADKSLMILKSHLVIERRILEFIKERVPEEIYKEIEKQREGAFQTRVLLAHALSGRDEIPSHNQHIIWPALRQLGSLRNEIAHNLEHEGSRLEDKMIDFIKKVDFDGKVLGVREVTDENLLRVFWYATITLNSLLAIERKPLCFADEGL